MSDKFPSTKYQRGKLFANAGLKAGKNYASYYLKSLINGTNDKSETHKKTAEQLFGDFIKLRGTALKIAQSFSIDQGFLPEEFTEVMSQAQYSVPPINRSLIRSIIKRELGSYPEQLFESFNTTAIAAASIGQVHEAITKDGIKVAVKIQYPGVRDTISSDLALARTLFKRFINNSAQIDEYLEEVRTTLLDETNYHKEGVSINHFHERFTSDTVVTPRWLPELSTERVLTMTFLEGVHMKEFLDSDPEQSDINHYGQILWDFFHDQIKDPNEIHADTHPGNFLFTPDRKLGILDFGCVKSFPEEFFMDYLYLLPTHLNRDEKEIKKLYKRMGVIKDDPEKDPKEYEFYQFCLNYGQAFALPYHGESFDFGDENFDKVIRTYTKNAPISNEPRGNKNFIYSTRAHLGLYHMLMKMGAEVNTSHSIRTVEEILHEYAL